MSRVFYLVWMIEELANLKNVSFKKYKALLRHMARLDLLILDDFLLNSMDLKNEMTILLNLLLEEKELNQC